MTVAGWLTIVIFAALLTLLALPLARYMARVYTGERVFLSPVLAGPERLLYRLLRVDPTQEPRPEETVLRVLVTEQTFANGQRANGRVLTPDVYIDEDELILRVFVTPRPGYQGGAPNPETSVRIALPHPLGPRRLIDGALAQFSPPQTAS